MFNRPNKESGRDIAIGKALGIVILMVSSTLITLVPTVYGSHTTQYAVQRDPSAIAVGDLDCDGDNDIIAASTMGHFLSVLYNDGFGNAESTPTGSFADRQDIYISNNDTRRAGFRDTADGTRAEIADVDGDEINDIIYYQQNIRFVGESFVRPANLTVLKGVCDDRVNLWEDMASITVTNPYLQDLDVADINGDGNADTVFVTTDSTGANQYIQVYMGPDYTLPINQQTIPVPLTNGIYTDVMLGHWGETVQGGGIGIPTTGDCEDLDLWLLRTPPSNVGVGYSAGHFDNMTVLEFNCLPTAGNVFYPNPMDPAAQGMHEFKLNVEHNYPLYGIDISDTTPDDDVNEIDLIAAIDGIEGRVHYATKSGTSWNTNNYVNELGNYLGASLTIADVNGDGDMDFFIPTELTLEIIQDSSSQNQTYLSLENLRATNTVEIILGDGSGGYLPSLSFDVGRRPSVAMPGQLQGGDDSALEIIIGQKDYAYRFANNAMWLDTQGWPGASDYLSVLTLDNFDLGLTGVTIEPSSVDPSTGRAMLGEGNRWVNVTVRNTGLNAINSGSVDVNLEVKEVLGGSDTVVYSHDFETSNPLINIGNAQLSSYSYTGEYSEGESSWHLETNSTADSENVSWYEADSNPTNYYWAGMDYDDGTNNSAEEKSGYVNHMDEAIILENIDLTGSDAAFMDISMMCSAGFFELFLAEAYSVVERWLYEDACGIEVWSEGNGWQEVSRMGGWDNERLIRLYAFDQDPEYNNYNVNFGGSNYASGWINYTEDGGISDDPSETESIDLTPYAGEIIDIRFRFRSGLEGTVGPAGSSSGSGLDGFAFDNLTIRKRNVEFGNVTDASQEISFTDLAAGENRIVQLSADFVNNTTYYISTSLNDVTITNPSGNSDQDSTNDEIKFQLTVKNLFDPGLAEKAWPSLENGQRYASGTRDIEVRVQNWGNTIVDFEVQAKIQNAEPDLIAIEDFSGFEPIWSDDNDEIGHENGSKLDDSSGTNSMLPQNVGIFNSGAYWLGHPDTGYGDNWNESFSIDPIAVGGSGADFTYLTFDYFAEGDSLKNNQGQVLAERDVAFLEIEWSKDGELYNGIVYGSWTDLNENGLLLAQGSGGNLYHYCEDFDGNGYDEVEYFGDYSDQYDSVSWYDSESLMKSVTLDLTHITVLNQTNSDSFTWTTECTTLANSDVSLTWRFQSNSDGVNGNAGLAGFAVDNIRVEEFTFEDDGTYSVPVNGMDSTEQQTVTVTNHDFNSGIYKIDVETIFNNSIPDTPWFNNDEVNVANNFSSIILSIASADITLMQPNVLDCASDITLKCVYPTNPDGTSSNSHSFSLPLLNGVIAGDYILTMSIVDITNGNTVYQQNADNGPFTLDPHSRATANWSSPYSEWIGGHTYNISFSATLGSDGEKSGNDRYFEILFMDDIDVLILSNPTDQNRLQRVKQDLESMGKTYTQLRVNDWETYATPDWVEHYEKVLLPWQTDYNVEYGDYYQLMGQTRDTDGLSLTETLENYMQTGGTVQMHLGPYRNDFMPERLPFGIDIAMRNQFNSTMDNRIGYDNISIIDPFHPIMSDVDSSAFAAVHGGAYVALSGLDISQVTSTQIPQVCGGRINSPTGTFHTLIKDQDNPTQSLMSVCNYYQGGLIVTTMDVENPSLSESYGGSTIPLLSSILDFHFTPYPMDFGIAGEGFDMTIDGKAPSIDALSGNYVTTAIRSNSELEFSFTTDVEGIFADWTLESGNNDSVTGWDGNILDAGKLSSIHQEVKDIPVNATLCVSDANSESGCKIDAQWILKLYLHDEYGHTRLTQITLYTNDVDADNSRPIANASIVRDEIVTAGNLEFSETKRVPIGIDSSGDPVYAYYPVYTVRLSESGDTSISFTAENSSDVGTGIKTYTWTIVDDVQVDMVGQVSDTKHSFVRPSGAGPEWSYAFKNVTANNIQTNQIRLELVVTDFKGLQSEKFRMFFVVVGELFGDDPPVVDSDNLFTTDGQRFDALDALDILAITGQVTSGAEEDCNVVVEISLNDISIFDKGEASKSTQKEFGFYDKIIGLCDGDDYNLALNISHLYDENDGNTGDIFIRISEGSYVIDDKITIFTLPRPLEDVSNEGESDSMVIVYGGLAALILLLVVGATFVLRNRSSDSDSKEDSIETFGGVEQMDPIEAYVQQMVGQGYEESVARKYAEEYYAQYYEQQRQSGS
tara:strand:+ start:7486 stop:14046 length:6561 start_codon:yes stop_codon:yes gene_type:complete